MKKEKSPQLEAKKFGKTMFCAFLLLGLLFMWRGKTFGVNLLVLAFLFLFFSWFLPRTLAPVQRGWMKIGHGLGWINTRILLSILFFIVLTPIRFFLWISKKDLLDQKIDQSKITYWINRESKTIDPKQYERLY